MGSMDFRLRKVIFLRRRGREVGERMVHRMRFVIREGKGAWVEVKHREIDGADMVEDVSFVAGGEGEMFGEGEIDK